MAKKKQRTDYLSSFLTLARYGVESVEYLLDAIEHLPIKGEPGNIPVLSAMHEIETKADSVSYAVYHAAEEDFITPIDRGDLIEITHALDSITDEVEDVVQELYMYNIEKLAPYTKKMCKVLMKEVTALYDAVDDIYNTKKMKKVINKITTVKDLEAEHDRLYVDGIRELFVSHADDPLYVMQWKNIYAALENAADTIEHAGAVLMTASIKSD